MEDRPKFVFSFLFYAFLLALILGILFQERLPDEFLGISSSQLFVYLLVGAVAVRFGWRVVVWFRSRDR